MRTVLAISLCILYSTVSAQDLSEAEAARVALKRAGITISKRQASIRGDEPPTAEVLKHLASQAGLEQLFIQNSKPDKVLANLPELPMLKELSIADPISDAGMANLVAFPGLTHLSINGPKVTDKGLKHLEGMKKLEVLKLYGTKVTKKGIDELYTKLPRCVADVSP